MADLGSDTSLVTALAEIEKKVIQAEKDRNNLETNLAAKGVEVVQGSKMSTLIDKVSDMKTLKSSNILINKGVTLHTSPIPEIFSYSPVIGGHNKKAYFFGYDSSMTKILEYDSIADVWTLLSSRLTSGNRGGVACFTYGDNIYIGKGQYGADINILNTITNTISAVNGNGYSWISTYGVVKGGLIYFLGGTIYGTSSTTVIYEYNPITNTHTIKKATVPTSGNPSVLHKGKIYHINYQSIYEYNEITDTLILIDTISIIPGGTTYDLVSCSDYIYIIMMNNVFRYNPETKVFEIVFSFNSTNRTYSKSLDENNFIYSSVPSTDNTYKKSYAIMSLV